jgi:nucleoside-triphosphatase
MGRLTDEFKNVILLTGTRQVGKTSLLRMLIPELKEHALELAGVISPAVFEGVEKTAIDLTDVRSGECRRLAEKRRDNSAGILTDRWVFNSAVLDWGNTILASIPACDVLIIDELGPLEFESGQGLQHGLTAVENGEYRLAIVVIRPELIETVLQHWSGALVIEVTRDLANTYQELVQRINIYTN